MRLFAFSLLFLANFTLFAQQPKQNSPYSRYGIGDPINQFFASQAGFGGQTAAFHDPFHLNILNPASFAHLRTTALETGLYAKYSYYKSRTATQDGWSGNLAYLALGFALKSPINEVLDKVKSPWQFGMGVSLTPYSVVGYNVRTIDTLPDLGIVSNSFEGSGGTYRLMWGGGGKYKTTSFGVNLGWVFGKAIYESEATFSDSFPTYRDNFRDDLGVNGFVWSLGAQHDFVLQYAENDKNVPSRWLTVGLTGEGNHDLRLRTDRLQIRSRGRLSTGQYLTPDTLVFQDGLRQTLRLPATFSLGVQYVKASKWKVGGQIGLESWSAYRNDARPETLHNTFSAAAGFEYIPDFASYNNYGKRIRYRLGGYFRQDPRRVNGQDLNDLGLTFGFGLPLILPRQQTSFVNAAFELGKLGADSPISEAYVRITVGFTLNDNTWFYKRRFE